MKPRKELPVLTIKLVYPDSYPKEIYRDIELSVEVDETLNSQLEAFHGFLVAVGYGLTGLKAMHEEDD